MKSLGTFSWQPRSPFLQYQFSLVWSECSTWNIAENHFVVKSSVFVFLVSLKLLKIQTFLNAYIEILHHVSDNPVMCLLSKETKTFSCGIFKNVFYNLRFHSLSFLSGAFVRYEVWSTLKALGTKSIQDLRSLLDSHFRFQLAPYTNPVA